MLKKVVSKMRSHKLALMAAFLVGILYVWPYFVFPLSLGDEYRGIPMMEVDNEDAYLFRMQEIVDGHRFVASPVLYEYKDTVPPVPPTGEYFYALPAMVLGVSLVSVLVASKFILPVILSLLVYFLVYRMIGKRHSFTAKASAVAASLFITLGYDLVDFRSVIAYLAGSSDILSGGFLIWSRPVNPILGAIFLFSFVLFVWEMYGRERVSMGYKIAGGLFLSLMFGTYFFSWGMALSFVAFLGLVALIQKNYSFIKNLFHTIFLALLFSLPYWYMVWKAGKNPWYHETVLRNGLFNTHYPLMNLLIVFALALFFALNLYLYFQERRCCRIQSWQWFSLAMLLAPLLAFNQQVMTGKTIWPFHFVQYSIPFAVVVIMVTFHKVFLPRLKTVWVVFIIITSLSSLVYGSFAQASVYNRSADYYRGLQSFKTVFNWLNSQEKDCVVLVYEKERKGRYSLNDLIPGFTHCNTYTSSWMFPFMPYERILDNYMFKLRLKGVSADEIDQYIYENKAEIRGELYSNWQGLFGIDNFPDFYDFDLDKRIKKLPEQYRQFMSLGSEEVFAKYRLDFVVLVGEKKPDSLDWVSDELLVFANGDFSIFSFTGR